MKNRKEKMKNEKTGGKEQTKEVNAIIERTNKHNFESSIKEFIILYLLISINL